MLRIYGHPVAAYYWEPLIALYERNVPFEFLMVAAVPRDGHKRDPHVDGEVKATLDKSYASLNRWMTGRKWTANDTFGIADIAAAPALFYAHWEFPIPESHAALRDYHACLLARPSIAQAIEEARPWRGNFPLKGRTHSPD